MGSGLRGVEMISLPFYVVFGVIFATGCALGMCAEPQIKDVSPSDYVMTVIFNALDAAVHTLMLAFVQFLLGV